MTNESKLKQKIWVGVIAGGLATILLLVETKKIFQGLNAQQISKLIKGEYQDGIGSIINGHVDGFDDFKIPDIYSVSTETTGHMFKFNVYMDLNDCYAKYINELNPDLRTPEMSKFLDLYQ